MTTMNHVSQLHVSHLHVSHLHVSQIWEQERRQYRLIYYCWDHYHHFLVLYMYHQTHYYQPVLFRTDYLLGHLNY